jgi:hypothetical protein
METWRAYERLVAKLVTEENENDNMTVIPNARLTGMLSKRNRQIDVLVDYRFDHNLSRRIIFDAKNRKRPLDVKEVEAFEGLMRDVGAPRGYLICTNGHTKAALNRAQQHIGIRIIPETELENINFNSWDCCMDTGCNDGLVMWDLYFGIIINGLVSVQATGKCDVCGKFHIWCWDCGRKFVIGSEDELQCMCVGPWFWLTSIEPEEDGSKGNYLIVALGNGEYNIVDRKPM